MNLEWIAAVALFAVAMAGTPGPNNTMVTASGANYGFRRTLPHVVGIALGVAGIMLLVAAVGSPLARNPQVHEAIKWAGIAYLLWLAWKIATAAPKVEGEGAAEAGGGNPLTVFQGASFQLVNPKLWTTVAGAIAAYAGTAGSPGPVATPIVLALLFSAITFCSAAGWTLIGTGAGRLLKSGRALRVFNWAMAALLVASLIPLVLE